MPLWTYFLPISLLLTRHHNRRQTHGIIGSILGVWVPSKYHVPLSTCILWILHSWNGKNCRLTRHNMQFIPDHSTPTAYPAWYPTFNTCHYSLHIGSNCTNQVSCYVGKVVVFASVATLALIPAVDTTTAVATNAPFPTTQSWSVIYPTSPMYPISHT